MTTECENIQVGREFLASQNWPFTLCNPAHDRCYCAKCYPASHKDLYPMGNHTYIIPRGWTRFGIRIDEPFAKHHDVWKSWLNCYHGTSIERAKSIVEHRQLLLPRDITLEGKTLEIRPGHIPEECFLFTTPTIKYAALSCYTETYAFTSPKTNKRYKIRVALQCKQKQDSFTVQGETVGARRRQVNICPHVPNEEIEWKTKQRSAVMPYGLLLQIVPDVAKTTTSPVEEPTKVKPREIICPQCSQIHILDDCNFKDGNVVTWACKTCKGVFKQFNCPHCSGVNIWKDSEYKEGRVYSCSHKNCRKKFQQINCPHCTGTILWSDVDYKQGKLFTCPYENCKKTFQQVNCPHCHGSNTWNNGNYKEGRINTCAYSNCKKTFQQVNCPHCARSIVWKDTNYQLGTPASCPYDDCKKTFVINAQ